MHTAAPWTVRRESRVPGIIEIVADMVNPVVVAKLLFRKPRKDEAAMAAIAENRANANLIAASPDLKDFAEQIKIYVIEGDEDHLHVKVGDSVVAVMRINSPEAVLWLHLEARRKAVLAKANGGVS